MSPHLTAAGSDPVGRVPGEHLAVSYDGAPLNALPGQTVAAALLAAGNDSWRRTRGGARPRGVFCGIGACFDCLVEVNGVPDVRACQRTLTTGDRIRTQHGAVLPTPDIRVPPAPTPDDDNADADADAAAGSAVPPRVVVVGAGPAGLQAALSAAGAGASVLLVDAAPAVGGQFHSQLPAEFHAARPDAVQHGWSAFARVRDRVRAHPRIEHLADTTVWAVEPVAGGHRLRLQTGPADAPGRAMTTVDTPALVLATGAYDRALPFPGWDLPGVYTAGAAQALAKGQRIAVGRRVLLAGTGPFLLPVAESLLGVGARVVALLDANPADRIARAWLRNPAAARAKLPEAARYAARLARHRVPVRHRSTVVAAHGSDRVEAVTTVRLDQDWNPVPGSERRVAVDALCLGFGFTAHLELAVAARCGLTTGPDGGAAVVVDDGQRTTVAGVLAAGEVTGIGGADLSAAEGHVAGTTAAGLLGHDAVPDARAVRAVARGNRIAAVLGAGYPVRPGWRSWLTGDTLVCRCEEVTYAGLRDAVGQRQARGARAVKLTSRAGLGLCQGRVCGSVVQALTATTRESLPDDPAATARRPLAVPVRLRDLAATPEPQEEK